MRKTFTAVYMAVAVFFTSPVITTTAIAPVATVSAVAVVATVTTTTPAVAGTYEDDVFPRGFPRWGSSSRSHEDRNRHYRHRHAAPRHGYGNRGRHAHGGQQVYGGRQVVHGRQTVVRERHERRSGSRQAIRRTAIAPVPTSSPRVVKQTVQHPFADVAKERQYRCAANANGVMVRSTPGTGWCYND